MSTPPLPRPVEFDVVSVPAQVTIEQIARIYRVPYWLIQGSKPSWLRRPLWRLRAWRWSRA